MHPLQVFPELLTFGLLAPFILRIVVGILRIFAGIERNKKEYNWLSFFYFASSILLIVGLYTQIAALAAILLVIVDFYTENKAMSLTREKKALTILTIAILLSILVTGPGIFSFDLPL